MQVNTISLTQGWDLRRDTRQPRIDTAFHAHDDLRSHQSSLWIDVLILLTRMNEGHALAIRKLSSG